MNVPASPPARWIRWIIAGYVFFSVVVTIGFVLQRANYQADRDRELATLAREKQAEKEADQKDCLTRQDGRAAVRTAIDTLRDLVTITAGPVDYSVVPGYSDLDPALKRFLTNATSGEVGTSFQATALARLDLALNDLPPIQC